MLGLIVLIITIIVLASMAWNPKLGSIFLWPMLFMYPHALMYGKLPLNIGIDDLFICVFFVFARACMQFRIIIEIIF